MAKDSVRKKGKKWYYRFYVEDKSAIDIAISKIGTKSKFNMEKHATKENHSKLIFCVEF